MFALVSTREHLRFPDCPNAAQTEDDPAASERVKILHWKVVMKFGGEYR
ncbi:hypothetical protein [Aliiroseovarius sp. F20344]|nr:hypothetical protein [Aliiroseovarius sp. F20344]MCK0142991.1 hypothetical protein [Aliiroseovarius sp. F20344]